MKVFYLQQSEKFSEPPLLYCFFTLSGRTYITNYYASTQVYRSNAQPKSQLIKLIVKSNVFKY